MIGAITLMLKVGGILCWEVGRGEARRGGDGSRQKIKSEIDYTTRLGITTQRSAQIPNYRMRTFFFKRRLHVRYGVASLGNRRCHYRLRMFPEDFLDCIDFRQWCDSRYR